MMSERVRQSMILDVCKVPAAGLATLGVCKSNMLAMVSGPEVKLFLECILLTVMIAYTALRLAKLRKDKKESDER